MMPLTLVDVDEDNIIKNWRKAEVKKHHRKSWFCCLGHVQIISKLS